MRPPLKKYSASLRASILLLLWAVPGFALSGIEIGHQIHQPKPQDTPIPFDQNDFIRITLDPFRNTIELGEPLILPFRLVNHTKFKVSIVTKFHPRANLSVYVSREGEAERQSYGPYLAGQYLPDDFVLYPMEEAPVDLVIWADRETPDGLVFQEPGKYSLRLELKIEARLSQVRGAVPLVTKDLTQVKSLPVTVLPASEANAPLVEQLRSLHAFPNLQLRNLRLPGSHEALKVAVPSLIQQFPDAPLTPYMDFAVANEAVAGGGADQKNDELYALAANHFQRAAAASSAFQEKAYLDLVRHYDRRGHSELARQAAEKLLQVARPERAAQFGSRDLVRKYLHNSAELDPARYWSLLE